MNKFGQFELNDKVIDKESGEHGTVTEVNPRIEGLPIELSKMIYAVEISDPLDTPTNRMYVTDELMLDAPDQRDVQINTLQAEVERLKGQLRDSYEFMRSEVNRLETQRDTLMIGLEQVQIAARKELSYVDIGNITAETFQAVGRRAIEDQ